MGDPLIQPWRIQTIKYTAPAPQRTRKIEFLTESTWKVHQTVSGLCFTLVYLIFQIQHALNPPNPLTVSVYFIAIYSMTVVNHV